MVTWLSQIGTGVKQMKLTPAQLKILTRMKDGHLMISTNFGAPYLEMDAKVTCSSATLRVLLKNRLIDCQHDGNWNSGSQTHQITQTGKNYLESLK